MRVFSCAILALLLAFALPGASGMDLAVADHKEHKLKEWKNVGGDPCRASSGCTLEWTMQMVQKELHWPKEVTDAFLQFAREGKPRRPYLVCSGDEGFFMTFGEYIPKFWPNTKAAWAEGKCESAKGWHFDFEMIRYIVYQVDACTNWGGDTEDAPEPEPETPAVRQPIIPLVVCD